MPQAALQATPQIRAGLLPPPVRLAIQPGWWVVGAAVRGVSHERMGLPCQDAFGYRTLENGLLLVAVADGAGTAQFSGAGAQLAVDETLSTLESALGSSDASADPHVCRDLLMQAFESTRQAIWRLAEEQGQSAREYATTLACVIASDGWLVAAQIGDGAIVVDSGAAQQAEYALVVRLQRGEYANETQFLTQADALEQVVVETLEQPVRALAVMSDGLIRLALKMPAQEPHAPFFQPLFRFATSQNENQTKQEQPAPAAAEQLTAFLQSERVNARTDDDKTLVLAIRISNQEQPRAESALEQGAR